ncbi:MAG: hypothetical protein JWM90_2448 [Thermoleophilia bacterium]|nr:hypothetical protein [Thermoleophilia bacterium]
MIRRTLTLALFLLLFVATPLASAATSKIEIDEANPRVAISPLRYGITTAPPGTPLEFELRVSNTSPDDVLLRFDALPLAGSTATDSLVEPAGPDSRSAKAVDWVTFASTKPVPLAAGTQLDTVVTVQVPEGARPGSYALGFAVSQRVSRPGVGEPDTPQSEVNLKTDLVATAILRVPGEAVSNARVRKISAPRVIWGGGRQEFRVLVENRGDTDLRLDAEVDLSAFLGSAGRTLETKVQPVLPDGRRELVLRWEDPPLLGWFQPTLVVVGGKGTGVRITNELATIWVLPPWWLIAALVLALGIPGVARHRRRRSPAWQAMQRARATDRVEQRLRVAEAKRKAAERRNRR